MVITYCWKSKITETFTSHFSLTKRQYNTNIQKYIKTDKIKSSLKAIDQPRSQSIDDIKFTNCVLGKLKRTLYSKLRIGCGVRPWRSLNEHSPIEIMASMQMITDPFIGN